MPHVPIRKQQFTVCGGRSWPHKISNGRLLGGSPQLDSAHRFQLSQLFSIRFVFFPSFLKFAHSPIRLIHSDDNAPVLNYLLCWRRRLYRELPPHTQQPFAGQIMEYNRRSFSVFSLFFFSCRRFHFVFVVDLGFYVLAAVCLCLRCAAARFERKYGASRFGGKNTRGNVFFVTVSCWKCCFLICFRAIVTEKQTGMIVALTRCGCLGTAFATSFGSEGALWCCASCILASVPMNQN